MPARRILQLGDPLLRQISVPVAPDKARLILRDLDATLRAFRATHGFGRGISAIQIGEPVRVIFLRFEGRNIELVNPVWLSRSEETFELWDDCFSFPHLMVRLRRNVSVRVSYSGVCGCQSTIEAHGALSELLQHEMDHLDGVLSVDHARTPMDFMTREEYLRRDGR